MLSRTLPTSLRRTSRALSGCVLLTITLSTPTPISRHRAASPSPPLSKRRALARTSCFVSSSPSSALITSTRSSRALSSSPAAAPSLRPPEVEPAGAAGAAGVDALKEKGDAPKVVAPAGFSVGALKLNEKAPALAEAPASGFLNDGSELLASGFLAPKEKLNVEPAGGAEAGGGDSAFFTPNEKVEEGFADDAGLGAEKLKPEPAFPLPPATEPAKRNAPFDPFDELALPLEGAAPGFGVSHATHLMLWASLGTRHAWQIHVPGLGLYLSNRFPHPSVSGGRASAVC
mmetsp:Transcript_16192/g.61716  ORF Transcript_16192/g.61716 Transcript_16192/m.61716 type:complete len:288 (+) Transcript_16192:193-1056(+)